MRFDIGKVMIIRDAEQKDKKQIAQIRPAVYKKMIADGLYQWDDEYPSEEILFDDIDNGDMIVAEEEDTIVGYVTVNIDIPEEYKAIDLRFSPKICVHRLSINPEFARSGAATALMEHVHKAYKSKGYDSICLDTCEDNAAAIGLYSKLGYIKRGYVSFGRRPKFRFPVMERKL